MSECAPFISRFMLYIFLKMSAPKYILNCTSSVIIVQFPTYLCDILYMLIFMRNAVNVRPFWYLCEILWLFFQEHLLWTITHVKCKHWTWSFKTNVRNSNSFVDLAHLISNLYIGSNMFIFKFWTAFLGERKIRTKFHSVNACCELKSRLFDFFNRIIGKCASWVQILFNYNLVVSTSNFSNM